MHGFIPKRREKKRYTQDAPAAVARDAPAAVARNAGGHQAAVPAAVVRDEISCDDLSVQPNLSCMISYDIQFLKNLFREIKLTVWVQTFRLFWIPDPGPGFGTRI